MAEQHPIRFGITGAGGRGGSFRAALHANGGRVQAVCDIRAEVLEEAARILGAEEKYTDVAEMLEQSDLDAVVIGTPMQFRVPQSILALERDVHVLCEVPAGVSLQECGRLVLAAGYRCICLQTDDFRLPAIRTYLKLGFEPLSRDPDTDARWRRALGALRRRP